MNKRNPPHGGMHGEIWLGLFSDGANSASQAKVSPPSRQSILRLLLEPTDAA
ncbi:hypothetical protein [Brenneria alni]|uniref:hypothetical protein n=1 Tax=Brenneria alni TaxID=71656 RepID=UPI0014755810|nr:hypothetical protein [Brenneria alni]